MRRELVEELGGLGLVERPLGKNRRESEWYYLEETTALLYMSLLAKYLADLSTGDDWMVPGTDAPQYSQLSYEPTHRKGESFPCLDIRFNAALPVPREDVSFDDILQFKRKRQTELLNFRAKLFEFQNKLRGVTDQRDVKDVVANFKDVMQKQLNEIGLLLKDSRISAVAQSISTLMSMKSPAMWSALAVATGVAKIITNIPLSWTLTGTTLAGTIQVGCSWLGSWNKTRAEVAKMPFAYIYYAIQEKII
jgi:hypothetical protein